MRDLREAFIKLRPVEIQSGLDRVKWAEGLIRQLPENHDGRNSWLLNYAGEKHEADKISALSAQPQPDAVEAMAWPTGIHPATLDLVKRFAVALAKKLRLAEEKYGYGDGWSRDDWEDVCRRHLYQHLDKGDPRDVAAYCAFMWHHGWITTAPSLAPDAARMRRALENLIGSSEAFLNYFNPFQLSSDKENQWLSVHDDIGRAREALSRADEGKKSEGGIMDAARKAKQRVDTWSDAKKDYAERATKSEGVPVRELTEQEQKCVEAALLASGTVVDELHPSDPTPPDPKPWPNGCRNPNSCAIHRDCMYVVCTNYDRDISGEVDDALSTRAGG